MIKFNFNFLTDLSVKYKRWKTSPLIRKYISHNKKVFICHEKRKSKFGPVVLFEFNNIHSAHIAYSYLANAVASEYGAEIIGLIPRGQSKLIIEIKKIFNLQPFGVYKSFGTIAFNFIKITKSQSKRAQVLHSKIILTLHDKWDVERIAINSVLLGDLIYDTYLKLYKRPTIDVASIEFQNFLLKSIETFLYWEDYFDGHDIRAINVSHCVYNLAIPLRLAIKLNIPSFQANVTHIYRMNKDNYFAYSDYHYFPKIFSELPENIKKNGIAEAKLRIEKRFLGEVGVDMAYSTKSAYRAASNVRLLKESSNKKILIATHCFFDSPHSYGFNIFPDFYEWLDFLGRMTELTNYDWYVKMHPDYLFGTKEIIENFVLKYPKFKLLPADASHHQIIAEGIDVALTVYGTIGFEYAALGVPVINCSINNPHIAYNFNLHPGNIDEYRCLLLNLDKLECKIDKQQVYEYYFMRYIYNTENLFFNSYSDTIKELGGYSNQFTDAIYGKWLTEWTSEKHQSISKAIKSYILSKDFRMDNSHFK